MVQENCVEMIKKLSDAAGPSGFEDDVLTVARAELEGVGTIEEDCLRNLYIYRKENTGKKPVLMLDAHGDEVGFMVHSIKPNGTLRFLMIGIWNLQSLPTSTVLVRNALGEYIPGVIALRPPHFSRGQASTAGQSGTPELSSLVIDIGATSKEEAERDFHIRIGEPVIPDTKCRFQREHGIFFGKAFDCRIGVAALIETMRRLQGKELPCDVVGVISAQEEVGMRGAAVAVCRVDPDIALCFEGCPADDTFTEEYAIQTALKKGPMLRHMDESIICSPRYQRFAMALAEEKDIPLQTSVREGGGNDGAVINTALDGVPVIVAGIPVRYSHAMNGITAYEDFESAVRLAEALSFALDEKTIRSF